MNRRRRSRSGSSLLEALVAMAIVSAVITGVLQTFFVAAVQNLGASARTQLTYKCQQVVEVIRTSQYLVAQGQLGFANRYGIGDAGGVLQPGTYNLPYVQGDPGWSAWGPANANIVERENDAFRISYVVETLATPPGFNRCLQVRVSATPDTSGASAQWYRGKNLGFKRVDYVAQILQ